MGGGGSGITGEDFDYCKGEKDMSRLAVFLVGEGGLEVETESLGTPGVLFPGAPMPPRLTADCPVASWGHHVCARECEWGVGRCWGDHGVSDCTACTRVVSRGEQGCRGSCRKGGQGVYVVCFGAWS